MTGRIDGNTISLGSSLFTNATGLQAQDRTRVFVSWNGQALGSFGFRSQFRSDLGTLIRQLKGKYILSVVSGDADGERSRLANLFGQDTSLLFRQDPRGKEEYVRRLQEIGDRVAMIGDGLNDAIALGKSNVGIAIADDINNFTPSSDAILEAGQLTRLPAFLRLCKANRNIIMASFGLSIVYNLVGLYFAVQGTLSPLVAAILMPLSSLTILLVTFGSSNLVASGLRLSGKNPVINQVTH
jgi:Cu+-exporting ATPase